MKACSTTAKASILWMPVLCEPQDAYHPNQGHQRHQCPTPVRVSFIKLSKGGGGGGEIRVCLNVHMCRVSYRILSLGGMGETFGVDVEGVYSI